VAALGAAWFGWARLTGAWDLDSVQWHTIPVGVLLLILGRIVARIDRGLIELSGVVLLVAGGALDVGANGPVSLAGGALLAQLSALLSYGIVARRRVPLVSVLVLVGGGMGLQLFLISPWLIPLMAGCVLLGGALLLEVHRDGVAQWVAMWAGWLR
jgi:hypothetical protein